MPDIPSQVARNRRSVKRLDKNFVEGITDSDQNLTFERNTITVEVAPDVYTRPLGNALISGHPDGETHGSGHGVSGDQRGAWTAVNITVEDSDFTRDGRTQVASLLRGGATQGGIQETAIGTGSGAVEPADSSLDAPTGQRRAYTIRENPVRVRARSNFLFAEVENSAGDAVDPQEFGILAGGFSFIARATLASAVGLTQAEELRVDSTFTVGGGGSNTSVFTAQGLSTVAEALENEFGVSAIAKIAWGTGTPTLDPANASLGNQVFEKDVQRGTQPEVVAAFVPQFRDEPSSQPHDYTEVAVINSVGTIFWLADLTDSPFPKDSQTQFTTTVRFRIV